MKTNSIITYPPLLFTLIKIESFLQKMLLVIATTVVIWVSAKIQIPFYPIPITLQTFLVLIIGMAYGWKLGAITILLYLAEGAIGIPVFAGTPEKGIGMAYLLGPTGGYIVGFFFAVLVVGKLAEKGWDRNIFTTFLAMVVGNVVIYLLGLLWLGSSLGWDNPILSWGFYPFLLGDLLKIALASVLMPSIWKIVKKRMS